MTFSSKRWEETRSDSVMDELHRWWHLFISIKLYPRVKSEDFETDFDGIGHERKRTGGVRHRRWASFCAALWTCKKKHVSVSSPMDSATDYGWGFLSPDKSRGRPTSSFTQQIWRLPDFCLFVCLFSTAVTVVHNLKKKDPVTTLLPKTKRSFPFKRCVDRNGIAGAKQIP